MVRENSIQGSQSAERDGSRSKGSIGLYGRGEFERIKLGLERDGWGVREYVPGSVETKFPKDGEFGPFDTHVSERWDVIEKEFQNAEHASRWVSANPDLDAIVVWEDFQPHGVGICDTAKDLGIPTVMITHGAVFGTKPGNFGNETYADYVCGTWAIRKMYAAFEQPIEVVPTGLAEFDGLKDVDRDFLRVANRKDLKWDVEKPVLTWIGTWNGKRTNWQPDEFIYFSAFVEAFKALREIEPDIQLNVCPHPNANLKLEWYKHSLEKNGITNGFKVLPQGTELWIMGSDLLVGATSSVMALGLLMGIPSVALDLKPWHEYGWYRYHGFELVANVRELTSMLAQLFATTDRYLRRKSECSKGASWFVSNPDGKAGARVLRTIERVASKLKPDEDCYAPIPE